MIAETTDNCTIDFEKFNSALNDVKLINCQGFVVRVSGLTVESNGPAVCLGQLCRIHIRNGRDTLAEVVGFHDDHLVLLPMEHIEGISPGDKVTARTSPRWSATGFSCWRRMARRSSRTPTQPEASRPSTAAISLTSIPISARISSSAPMAAPGSSTSRSPS